MNKKPVQNKSPRTTRANPEVPAGVTVTTVPEEKPQQKQAERDQAELDRLPAHVVIKNLRADLQQQTEICKQLEKAAAGAVAERDQVVATLDKIANRERKAEQLARDLGKKRQEEADAARALRAELKQSKDDQAKLAARVVALAEYKKLAEAAGKQEKDNEDRKDLRRRLQERGEKLAAAEKQAEQYRRLLANANSQTAEYSAVLADVRLRLGPFFAQLFARQPELRGALVEEGIDAGTIRMIDHLVASTKPEVEPGEKVEDVVRAVTADAVAGSAPAQA